MSAAPITYQTEFVFQGHAINVRPNPLRAVPPYRAEILSAGAIVSNGAGIASWAFTDNPGYMLYPDPQFAEMVAMKWNQDAGIR